MGKIRIVEVGFSREERVREIDNQTKSTIKQNYEIEDELKLLRRAIVKIAETLQIDLGEEFTNYNNLVETLVMANKKRKAKIKNAPIKIRQHLNKRR